MLEQRVNSWAAVLFPPKDLIGRLLPAKPKPARQLDHDCLTEGCKSTRLVPVGMYEGYCAPCATRLEHKARAERRAEERAKARQERMSRCVIAGCNNPRHVYATGYTSSRCHEHTKQQKNESQNKIFRADKKENTERIERARKRKLSLCVVPGCEESRHIHATGYVEPRCHHHFILAKRASMDKKRHGK